MCPSVFKSWGWAMPVLTSAQLVDPLRSPTAVPGLAQGLCARDERPNFRSGNETLERSLDGTKSQLALMMAAASCLDLVELIMTSFHCSCFTPVQAPSLPQGSLSWGISFCPAGKASHKLPITGWWKVLGESTRETAKAVLLFEVLKVRHQEVLLF